MPTTATAATAPPSRHSATPEPNLSVFLNKHAFDVEMADDKTIRAVKAVDTLTGAITVYRGKFMVDTTGDGWIGYFAKAEYRLGREAKSEFNESLAPEQADHLTMSGCLMGNGLGFRAVNTGREVPFVRPPWAREIALIDSPGRRIRTVASGEWWGRAPPTTSTTSSTPRRPATS